MFEAIGFSQKKMGAETYESMAPNFFHVHSFRMPDMSFQPYLLAYAPRQFTVRPSRTRFIRLRSRCRFSKTWVRLNRRYKVRFLPSIFLVTFFGFAASFGVYSDHLVSRILCRRKGNDTSDIAFALNLLGSRLTLWLAARRRRWRGRDWNALTVHESLFSQTEMRSASNTN